MRVNFDFSTSQISIEGDGPELLELLQTVRAIAPQFSDIRITTNRVSPPLGATPPPPAVPPAGNGKNTPALSGQTLRQFVRALPLDNAAERIAAIAYYEKYHDDKDTFAPKEMDGWFTICGFQKPSQMPVAIFDTKRKYGFIDSAGRAQWRLTNSGENLVVGKQNNLEESEKQ